MCRFSTVALPVEANCAKELGAYDGRREWISHEISWQCWEVHFGKLTWNLKINLLKRNLIFQTSIFVFHINFPCCEWLKSVPFQWNRWCDPPGDRPFSSKIERLTFDDLWWLTLLCTNSLGVSTTQNASGKWRFRLECPTPNSDLVVTGTNALRITRFWGIKKNHPELQRTLFWCFGRVSKVGIPVSP